MFCVKCGKKIKDNAKFCPGCGAPAYDDEADRKPEQPAPEGQWLVNESKQISEHIVLCEDGVYRWIYEYSLFRHPGLFFLLLKVFFGVALGIFAFVMIIQIAEGSLDGDSLKDILTGLGIGLGVLFALVLVSYLIYAAIMGGKYIVVFEMNEDGINHRQIPKQAQKMHKVASATFLMGLASGNLATMGAGMNMRTEMYTGFSATSKVKPYPRKNLIKIRELLSCNQVFAYDEDFDFVLNYICSRVPPKAVKK